MAICDAGQADDDDLVPRVLVECDAGQDDGIEYVLENSEESKDDRVDDVGEEQVSGDVFFITCADDDEAVGQIAGHLLDGCENGDEEGIELVGIFGTDDDSFSDRKSVV